ncbi:hypothetical protein [Ramlibacter albus]|uniref:Uncharacterized protein n=1 Tax=Ramlibacter albus TaxID=2079448 RepID=A0A923S169_9BURK|nr:hypothetical protein [Ramlibacter albus]MBC5763343.1 hypothetical protein [Ramlibacter albus]
MAASGRGAAEGVMVRHLVAFGLAFVCISAQAGIVREAAGRVIVSGQIAPEDASRLLDLLARNPGIDTVLFHECRGGTLGAANAFATIIRDRKLKTLAAGQCTSACALAFLAGVPRRFEAVPGFSMIGLHAPRLPDSSGPSSDAVSQKMLQWVERATGGKLSKEVMDLIASSWAPASGVMFMSYNVGSVRMSRTVYCDGTQDGTLEKCRTLRGADALSQGIVTE